MAQPHGLTTRITVETKTAIRSPANAFLQETGGQQQEPSVRNAVARWATADITPQPLRSVLTYN
jgi:hypothetical protein